MKRSALITLTSIATLASIACSASAQVFVRPTSWFNPNGTVTAPYSNLAAAAWVASEGSGQVRATGTIYQEITINRPCTITSTTGPATISGNAIAETDIRVGSYNVRLWPGFFVSLTIADHARAALIGPRLDTENCDVIGLQEVWDYGLDIPDASAFINAVGSGYPWRFYGADFAGNGNNSGLLTLSPHPLFSLVQNSFVECDGNDCSANKGWTRASFVKDGFHVTVFNTHAQAGNSSENRNTRLAQIIQIANDVNIFRNVNPSHVVLVVGDFNIDRYSSEFTGNMSNVMGGTAGLSDGDTNAPFAASSGDCTACSYNTIKQIFDNGGSSTVLDHILYIGSRDGTVKIIPTSYEIKRFRRTDGGEWCRNVIPTGCGDDLSDHEPVFMNFNLRRIAP